ncbi:MAG: MFS transporter [Negativicutes bacterium]|nr:MFS transporter [Negativicutes bacterium]
MSTDLAKMEISKPRGTVRYEIWVIMFLAFFMAYLDRANISVLIANGGYTEALGIAGDRGSQGLLMTSFLFFYGLASFFIGPVIDRIGPRKVLIYNLLLWAGIMIVMGAVASFKVHIFCRVILGLTEAMAAPVCSKLIHTWFPAQERAKANGVWFVGLNFSLLAGIPIVAWLVAVFGWSGSFYSIAILNIIPVFACLAIVYDTVAAHPRISKEEVEYISAGKVEDIHSSGTRLTSYKFLTKKVFWLTTIVYSFNLASFWGIQTWLPTYLITTHGFSWAKGGLLSGVPYGVNILFLLIFTPLMDKYNTRAPFTAGGCVFLTVSMFLVTLAGDPIMALTAISIGFGCITMANCSLFPILQNGMDSNEVAAAVGCFTGFAYVFSSAFPYIMGAIYKYLGSLDAGFYLLGVNGVISVLATLPMVRNRL